MNAKQLFKFAWILIIPVLFSCSDAEEETIVPNYVGSWGTYMD